MVKLTINESSKQAKAIVEMLKTFDFVTIEESASKSNDKESKFIKDIDAGLAEVKKIREGKIKPMTLNELLNEK